MWFSFYCLEIYFIINFYVRVPQNLAIFMSSLGISANGLGSQILGSHCPTLSSPSSSGYCRLGLRVGAAAAPGQEKPSWALISHSVQIENETPGCLDKAHLALTLAGLQSWLVPCFLDLTHILVLSTGLMWNFIKLQPPPRPSGVPSSPNRNLNKPTEETDGLWLSVI